MNRPTIRDIARESGVSTTAVSFALNDRPGVSPETRKRILSTAKRIGWVPNARAQSLSLGSADAVGLYIARKPDSYNSERFFFNFIIGLEQALTAKKYDLVFHTGPDSEAELSTYRNWYAQGRVDGVVLVDPRVGDPRLAELDKLGLPAVVVGNEMEGTACVVGDESAMINTLAAHLVERGARSIGYVSGMRSLLHTQERIAALEEFGEAHGIDVVVVAGEDATEESGREAIEGLAEGSAIPDGLIFDNEVLAVGGLNALRAAGRNIGRDVLICSCEDSPLCRIVRPSITVTNREPAEIGRQAATLLLEVIRGEAPRSLTQEAPSIIIRDSTEGIVS
ncbi:LacI family DNA-binding transcriptional regulator [Arcanobacterium canis]|uniref:LacI family DNA-binding transcriptional regulator n=1 Tax=Arcanobacterium canis TaxID=999183 RepID=A0ABY8FWT5_9ACTO|nr:LacI family DNA-binding transcriptional regulator [Arcanobacterium canis]WFM82975.1 LacI family DNA-binding transcriptional regulator [Arcanobacterium canis]